jgi:phosphoglycolate phosphatase-like HAD superfamily hydrolase
MVGDSTWDALAAVDAGAAFIGVHAPPKEFAALEPPVPAYATLAAGSARVVTRRT